MNSGPRKKIHYHSDCYFFAGCENMLVNFWSSPAMRSEFEVSFSYRACRRYVQGLAQRAHVDFPVYALRFPDLTDHALLPGHWPLTLKRIVLFCLRVTLTVPLLGYEIWLLRRLFLRVRPSILHINNGGYPAALSARAAAIAGHLAHVPAVLMVVNNLAVGYSRPGRWFSYPLDRMVANSVSLFVTGSRAAAEKLKKVLRLNGGQCTACHNGIAARPITETAQESRMRLGVDRAGMVVFGVVAVLRPNKGHRVLLEAMRKLVERSPDVASHIRILIEGDGPERAALLELCMQCGLSGHCVFTGCESNIMNFINALDVLILPSVNEEDFPNVVLEAMALGKPVIASRIAGTPEQVIDGRTGILVAPRSDEQLANGIATLATDAQLRLAMSEAGRARFEREFRAEIAVRNYMNFYQLLLGTSAQ